MGGGEKAKRRQHGARWPSARLGARVDRADRGVDRLGVTRAGVGGPCGLRTALPRRRRRTRARARRWSLCRRSRSARWFGSATVGGCGALAVHAREQRVAPAVQMASQIGERARHLFAQRFDAMGTMAIRGAHFSTRKGSSRAAPLALEVADSAAAGGEPARVLAHQAREPVVDAFESMPSAGQRLTCRSGGWRWPISTWRHAGCEQVFT